MKQFLKRLLGQNLTSFYHKTLAVLANIWYGFPSEKLVVIGVTGTNGKSTTVNLIAKILEQAGHRVALSSTVNFKLADQETLNDLKMTMPGRFFLQKFLKQAVIAGCDFAVLEVSSEGIAQSRHKGIHFDCLVFTNLTPEHLESHGGFKNYKAAKLKVFQCLESLSHKVLQGKKIPKIIVANKDDQYFSEFTNFRVDRIISFGQSNDADVQGKDLSINPAGIAFSVNREQFKLQLKGGFDLYNALAAIAVAYTFDINLSVCQKALEKAPVVPGRMEVINQGQPFTVLVDYAPEPMSLAKLYESIKTWPHQKIIHVLGSTGGGRDKSRRPILGQIAASNADVVIVTNEDPYEEDPAQIINQVAQGALDSGKILDQNLFKILDRRQAIAKALSLAEPGDLVIITGKGSEQKMAVTGGYIAWDDRRVVIEELNKLKNL